MYGPLLFTIIFAILFALSLLWAILPYRLYKKYDKKCYYTDANGEQCAFYPDSIQEGRMIKAGREEEVKRLRKCASKKRFWYKQYNTEFISAMTAFALGLTVFTFGLICIISPIEARHNMVVWTEFAEIVEETFENAEEYEKYGIAGDVAEYNKWLAEARASKKQYGNWSSYYFCDIDSLQPISLRK